MGTHHLLAGRVIVSYTQVFLYTTRLLIPTAHPKMVSGQEGGKDIIIKSFFSTLLSVSLLRWGSVCLTPAQVPAI